MAREDDIAKMRDPWSWPFQSVLCLAHVTERNRWGTPLCGVLAFGHGPTVYVANVEVFEGSPLQSRAAFEAKLKSLPFRKYESFEALWLAGWRVD